MLAVADPVDDLASVYLEVLLPVDVSEVMRKRDLQDEFGIALRMD